MKSTKRKTSRKKMNKKNKTTRKKDVDTKLTDMNKCNGFCSKYYLKKRKESLKNLYKEDPSLRLGKTNKEIDKYIKDMEPMIISDCKQVYCNPNCPNIRKHLRYNYACPICMPKFNKINKKGAITYCSYDAMVKDL